MGLLFYDTWFFSSQAITLLAHDGPEMVIFRVGEDVLAKQGYLNEKRPTETNFGALMPMLQDGCRRAYKRVDPIKGNPNGYIQVSGGDFKASATR